MYPFSRTPLESKVKRRRLFFVNIVSRPPYQPTLRTKQWYQRRVRGTTTFFFYIIQLAVHPDTNNTHILYNKKMASGQPKAKTQQVIEQVEEVKGIMHNNIELMLQNHDKVENLQDKTEMMSSNAKQFKRQATAVKRQMWWRNLKLQIIIVLVVLGVLAIIIVPIALKLKN
eukprot:TRINITY_DN4341_c0_g1_i1.p1 TRINITY_DN4341_c0_g1~~TRINITY_DN4341_c0_g1_i1.p1  ORF type:complete len:171 (+),score=38.47 TRINITY_DN4341_c0_g1_i1:1119-1631(+)